MDDNPTTGQCLCGAVKFCISGEFESFFLCHCSRCRKDSGSAHSANLFSSTARLTWVSGVEGIKTFRLSGSRHVKSFCSDCGSALPVSQPEVGLLVVPAGSLDSRIDIRPNAHICCSSRANWDNDLASIERIDGLPGGTVEAMMYLGQQPDHKDVTVSFAPDRLRCRSCIRMCCGASEREQWRRIATGKLAESVRAQWVVAEPGATKARHRLDGIAFDGRAAPNEEAPRRGLSLFHGADMSN